MTLRCDRVVWDVFPFHRFDVSFGFFEEMGVRDYLLGKCDCDVGDSHAINVACVTFDTYKHVIESS